MKIILKNNTELIVTDKCTSTSIVSEFKNVEDIEVFRKELTDENLSSFKYVNDNGDIFGNYENYTFESVTYFEDEEENIVTAVFNIRQLSDIEIRLNALEEGQETQDGAIEELAGIVGGE